MDFSRFRSSDWMVVGGGALMLIAGFLAWFTAKATGASAEAAAAAGVGAEDSANAFEYFFTGIVPWILLVGAAVLVLLLVGQTLKANVPPMVILAIVVLALLLIVIRVIIGHGEDIPEGAEIEISRSLGLWLALIAGVISTVGAFLNFSAAGGHLKDFADVDKLRGPTRKTGR